MFRPNFDPLIVIWVIPDQNKNESLHCNCCNVPSDCWLDVNRAIYQPFLAAAVVATGLWTEPFQRPQF